MESVLVPCRIDTQECVPTYATERAAGADLRAYLDGPIVLSPGERRLIPTGVRVEIPGGFEGQVRPRSGLALKNGITLLNSPGTIDADYRGEIMVLMINLSAEPQTIAPNDRIAQLVIAPIARAEFLPKSFLAASDRGEQGFGSTGR